MSSIEKVSRTSGKIARGSEESYEAFVGHIQSSLDRGVRFSRGWLGSLASEAEAQSEANREAALRVIGRAEVQREAVQTLIEASTEAYLDLLSAPLAYYRQGLDLFESGGIVESFPMHRVSGGAFPIPGYDRMSVAEISRRLDGLSAAQVEEIRAYERRNKSRGSLLAQLDRRIKNAS